MEAGPGELLAIFNVLVDQTTVNDFRQSLPLTPTLSHKGRRRMLNAPQLRRTLPVAPWFALYCKLVDQFTRCPYEDRRRIPG